MIAAASSRLHCSLALKTNCKKKNFIYFSFADCVPEHEFMCPMTGECIPLSWICDGPACVSQLHSPLYNMKRQCRLCFFILDCVPDSESVCPNTGECILIGWFAWVCSCFIIKRVLYCRFYRSTLWSLLICNNNNGTISYLFQIVTLTTSSCVQ